MIGPFSKQTTRPLEAAAGQSFRSQYRPSQQHPATRQPAPSYSSYASPGVQAGQAMSMYGRQQNPGAVAGIQPNQLKTQWGSSVPYLEYNKKADLTAPQKQVQAWNQWADRVPESQKGQWGAMMASKGLSPTAGVFGGTDYNNFAAGGTEQQQMQGFVNSVLSPHQNLSPAVARKFRDGAVNQWGLWTDPQRRAAMAKVDKKTADAGRAGSGTPGQAYSKDFDGMDLVMNADGTLTRASDLLRIRQDFGQRGYDALGRPL